MKIWRERLVQGRTLTVKIGFAYDTQGNEIPEMQLPDRVTGEDRDFAEKWLKLAAAPDSQWDTLDD